MQCSLYLLDRGNEYVVTNMPMKGLVYSLGLREGVRIEIISRQPFGGPIVIKIGDRSVALAKELALKIQVEKVQVQTDFSNPKLMACG